MAKRNNNESGYALIVAYIFAAHYKKGLQEFTFSRNEIADAVKALNIPRPKNEGDVVYSYRYRKRLPDSIVKTQPDGYEWIIQGAIIGNYALGDEQALLAKVRYNRLIDIFLGITAFSLQNHLRTTVKSIGQIEIDEIYVGVDKHGRQYVIPVQAKGGNDQHGVVQTSQDVACCAAKFPHLICRPVSVQFVTPTKIAMFELAEVDDDIKVADEKHYHLVPASDISLDDLALYRKITK